MLGLAGKVVVNNKNNKQTIEKLQEWLDSLPEIVKQRESANVLAFVFFIELLNEKEKGKKVEGVDINVCPTDIFMPKEDFEEFKAGESVIGINVSRLNDILKAETVVEGNDFKNAVSMASKVADKVVFSAEEDGLLHGCRRLY